MASWTLGKIFSVDEEREATQEPSVSGNDSEEDEDVLERQGAFNKAKSKNAPVTGSNRSIRRYDEYGNFLSRSERAREDKAKEQGMAKRVSNVLNLGGGKGKCRVSFHDDQMEQVREIPRLTGEEKEACYMTTANWQSIDTDIDITTKRWANHMEGTIPFDEDNNSIRGIEDMIFRLNKSKPIMDHRKAILEEVVRQKTANEYPNWDRLSSISRESSAPQLKTAIELAKEDEKEKNRVWETREKRPESVVAASTKKKDKSKRKSSFFGLFKKK